MSEASEAVGTGTDHHAGLPADKVMETRWRWKLLLLDAVLALGLFWILLDLYRSRQEAEAREGSAAPAGIEAPAVTNPGPENPSSN
jgi:hypothetical protein